LAVYANSVGANQAFIAVVFNGDILYQPGRPVIHRKTGVKPVSIRALKFDKDILSGFHDIKALRPMD
jgi:hypothetical protein